MGLLLVRATVGLALMVQGGACLGDGGQGQWTWAFGSLAIVTGASLLIGCLTPVASVVAVLLSVSAALSWLSPSIPNVFGGAPATIFLAVMAAAVLLLGPGAFSLDARWFGRREIAIIRRGDR